MSGRAANWTCPRCLRLVRVMERLYAHADRLPRKDFMAILQAVVPGAPGADYLTEAEGRRVLVVLDKVRAR
jgi:hypothetical protein